MSQPEQVRDNLMHLVQDLRHTLQEIGGDEAHQANAVTDARDRLRYISHLTEQAASQTLQAAEQIADTLRTQLATAQALSALDLPTPVRDFLASLGEQHQRSLAASQEIMMAQEFQDLVGQMVNKLLTMIERMEDNLVHLLIDDDPEANRLLNGPQLREADKVNQDEIDSLFG